ncbi:MAG TPA: class F sortase [Egibacteraceae bacterium]|nr:class F sortase [Egibacteraceae bacterium]
MTVRTTTPHNRRPGFPPAVVLMAFLALLLSACGAADTSATAEPPPGDPAPPLAADDDQRAAATAAIAEEVAQRREEAMAGATLEIPAIGVSTPLISLGLNDDQTMEVPADFAVAGWYRYSPTPGEHGPSVIAGHVDSHTGPAVFFRLTDLQPGDEVTVRRADGTTATFAVQRVEQHPKDAFPHDEVYGDTEGPELRLITCGGVFDPAARSHRDNMIVYASIVG